MLFSLIFHWYEYFNVSLVLYDPVYLLLSYHDFLAVNRRLRHTSRLAIIFLTSPYVLHSMRPIPKALYAPERADPARLDPSTITLAMQEGDLWNHDVLISAMSQA